MKIVDIKKMQKDELDKKVLELKTELMKLYAQVAVGTTPKSTKQIREIKKNLARFQTYQQQQFSRGMVKLQEKVRPKRYIHS